MIITMNLLLKPSMLWLKRNTWDYRKWGNSLTRIPSCRLLLPLCLLVNITYKDAEQVHFHRELAVFWLMLCLLLYFTGLAAIPDTDFQCFCFVLFMTTGKSCKLSILIHHCINTNHSSHEPSNPFSNLRQR